MDVTIAVATFGDEHWKRLAWERAIPSALAQAPCVHAHRDTLHEARNGALDSVQSEWVIFLDADDELEPGYVAAMERGSADVRGPLVRYIREGGRENLWQPAVAGHHHECTADCLRYGNWLIVGSAVRAQMVRDAGGWRDFPWSEDWSTWLRCYRLGATFELIRDAIYRAHVRPDSRNRAATQAAKLDAHHAIYRDAFPEEFAA